MPAERLVDVGHAAFLDAAVDRPAEQQLDRAEQQRALGRRAASACRSARPRRSPAVEFDGTCACALAHVELGAASAPPSPAARAARRDRRVDAVRQNASSVRCSRRSCSDGELRRAREVDRAHAAAPLRRGLLLGQPAFARRVDQRGDRVRAEDGSAHAAASTPPATSDLVDAAGLAHGHAPRADVDADRAAAVAAGLGGDDRDARGARAGRARRPRCAGRLRARC